MIGSLSFLFLVYVCENKASQLWHYDLIVVANMTTDIDIVIAERFYGKTTHLFPSRVQPPRSDKKQT